MTTSRRITTRGVPHSEGCRCDPCLKRKAEEERAAHAFTARRIAGQVTPDETVRRFTMRATIEPDPAHGVFAGSAPLLLGALGLPEMPDWMLGQRVRGLRVGLSKLMRHHNAEYLILFRYYAQRQSEEDIGRALDVPRNRVRDALRFCVGYLHGCLDTDGEHARLRGVTVDMLYEGYVDDELDHLFNPDGVDNVPDVT